jgi:hypothetical protein
MVVEAGVWVESYRRVWRCIAMAFSGERDMSVGCMDTVVLGSVGVLGGFLAIFSVG